MPYLEDLSTKNDRPMILRSFENISPGLGDVAQGGVASF
jgi:hypothetical protein